LEENWANLSHLRTFFPQRIGKVQFGFNRGNLRGFSQDFKFSSFQFFKPLYPFYPPQKKRVHFKKVFKKKKFLLKKFYKK